MCDESLPILYSFRRCPYAMRARMAIKQAGLSCELREVVLKTKPQAMLEASPKGTVPVLVIGNRVIDESLEIMRYALQRNNLNKGCLQEFSHPLLGANDGEFKYYLDRYKYFDRYPEFSQQDYFEKALGFLQQLEIAMVEGEKAQSFLVSDTLSVIDMAVFPFVRQFALVDKIAFDELPYERLKKWFECLLVGDEFLSVMTRYPQWSAQDADPVYF